VIRKANLADIPFLLELLKQSSDKLLQRTAEEYKEVIGNTWVAVDNDRIVGCATLEIYSPKIAEIRSVAVDKAFRKRGVGTQLVRVAAAEAKAKKIYEVMVVTSNPEFFRSLGFGQCLDEKYALFLGGR
jgi:N-acetylglutamate synthase-like GNAT family acetyltransferase